MIRHHSSSFSVSHSYRFVVLGDAVEKSSKKADGKKKKDKEWKLFDVVTPTFRRLLFTRHPLAVLNHFMFPLKASSPFQSLPLTQKINRYISNTETHSVFIFCLLSLLSRVINCKHHHFTVVLYFLSFFLSFFLA